MDTASSFQGRGSVEDAADENVVWVVSVLAESDEKEAAESGWLSEGIVNAVVEFERSAETGVDEPEVLAVMLEFVTWAVVIVEVLETVDGVRVAVDALKLTVAVDIFAVVVQDLATGGVWLAFAALWKFAVGNGMAGLLGAGGKWPSTWSHSLAACWRGS